MWGDPVWVHCLKKSKNEAVDNNGRLKQSLLREASPQKGAAGFQKHASVQSFLSMLQLGVKLH